MYLLSWFQGVVTSWLSSSLTWFTVRSVRVRDRGVGSFVSVEQWQRKFSWCWVGFCPLPLSTRRRWGFGSRWIYETDPWKTSPPKSTEEVLVNDGICYRFRPDLRSTILGSLRELVTILRVRVRRNQPPSPPHWTSSTITPRAVRSVKCS